MHIVYYVTGHGFGHGVRTVAICNSFRPDVRLTIKSTLPENFFHEELRRPFDYSPEPFDCGCVQNDCMSIDKEKTLALYRAIAEENASKRTAEVAWCKERRVDVVVSDIVPFAFEIARHAGLPSVGVSNFTWYDIYKEYLPLLPDYSADVEKIREQYASATLMCSLTPALPMPYFPRLSDIPVVGRNGRDRRKEIIARFDLDPAKRLGLIYFGNFGVDNVDFSELRQFTEWEFLGICALPGHASNYRQIRKIEFPYQDLVASVDVMIGKIGYGAIAECMLHGTPLIYPPRCDFAEFSALDAAAREWGGGHLVSIDGFLSFAWKPALDSIVKNGPPPPVASNGERLCAEAIERIANRE